MRTDRIRIASRLYTKIMHYLTTLTIAGSDCSGGAGIQADIKTLSALGCYAASVITAVTVQNTCGVQSVYPLPAEIVRQQIRAVLSDLKPTAIQIGMLGNYEIARAVSEEIADYKETAQFVLDPIICSSNGHPLVTPDTIACMQDMLFPLCTLITPNLPETSYCDKRVSSHQPRWFSFRPHHLQWLLFLSHLSLPFRSNRHWF